MALTWDKRLPFIGSDGKKKVVERAMACAGEIARVIKVSEAAVRGARLLGCGNYGCTLLIDGLPRDRSVIKITGDNLEANAAARILDESDAPDGIVKIHKVARLGKCSVGPRMRAFEYKQASGPSWNRQEATVRYQGPGAPYRPLWVLQREELDDAWSHLKGRVKQTDVNRALDTISTYARYLTAYNTSFGRADRYGPQSPNHDAVGAAAKLIRGEQLVEAIEWLVERDMSWLDMRKVINLGWRDGVGLVIRDVGATESGPEMLEDIETVGGASGQLRRRVKR